VQVAADAPDVFPAGQGAQSEAAVAPSEPWKVPEPQASQPLLPPEFWYVPVPQRPQPVDAAAEAWYFPAGQAMHAVDPVDSW
jgi:hypothetical protein